jgi:hypothetical protein
VVPVLSQINPFHTTASISVRSILILSYHLHLCLPSGLFLSGFPTEVLYAFLLQREQVMKFSLLHFLCSFNSEDKFIPFRLFEVVSTEDIVSYLLKARTVEAEK